MTGSERSEMTTRPSDAAIALKPCPFCGCHVLDVHSHSSDRHTIKCSDCPGRAEFYSSSLWQAKVAWNRRAIDAEAKDVPAEVGAVVAALKRRFSEIEDEIAANRTTAPQVFTWMRTAALAAIASAPTAPNEGERHGS